MVTKNSIVNKIDIIDHRGKSCDLTGQLCTTGNCGACFVRKQWDTVLGVAKDNRAEWIPE